VEVGLAIKDWVSRAWLKKEFRKIEDWCKKIRRKKC